AMAMRSFAMVPSTRGRSLAPTRVCRAAGQKGSNMAKFAHNLIEMPSVRRRALSCRDGREVPADEGQWGWRNERQVRNGICREEATARCGCQRGELQRNGGLSPHRLRYRKSRGRPSYRRATAAVGYRFAMDGLARQQGQSQRPNEAGMIRRRHVIYVEGYDPRGAEAYCQLFRRECDRFQREWPVRLTLRPLELESHDFARW